MFNVNEVSVVPAELVPPSVFVPVKPGLAPEPDEKDNPFPPSPAAEPEITIVVLDLLLATNPLNLEVALNSVTMLIHLLL